MLLPIARPRLARPHIIKKNGMLCNAPAFETTTDSTHGALAIAEPAGTRVKGTTPKLCGSGRVSVWPERWEGGLAGFPDWLDGWGVFT